VLALCGTGLTGQRRVMLEAAEFWVLASLLPLRASFGAEHRRTPPRASEEVIKAWKKAGFKFGWYGKDMFGKDGFISPDTPSRLRTLLKERPAAAGLPAGRATAGATRATACPRDAVRAGPEWDGGSNRSRDG